MIVHTSRPLGDVAHLFCLVFGESNDDGRSRPCLRCLFRVLVLQLNDLRLQPLDLRLQLNDLRLQLLDLQLQIVDLLAPLAS